MANEKDWQQDISTTVDTHTDTLNNHETRIFQNENKLSDHEKRIDNIETTSDVGQIATRVQAIEDKNTEQDSAIDTLKKDVSDNLQTAKQYTETKLADYATKTENSDSLEQAKQYANSKADDALSQAQTDASQKYYPLTGGALTAQVISRDVNCDCLRLYGGIPRDSNSKEQGALIILNARERKVSSSTINNHDVCATLRTVDLNGELHDFNVSADGRCDWNKQNIVRSVNNVNADINGNVTLSSVKFATKATQDGNGSNIVSTYVKLASAQTISAQHDFSTGVKIGGCLITVG